MRSKDTFYRMITRTASESWLIDLNAIPRTLHLISVATDLIILHEVNPIFIILPALNFKRSVKMPLDDLLDEYSEACAAKYTFYQPDLASMKILKESKRVHKSAEMICEVSNIDDNVLYRFSPEKFNALFRLKVIY
eukprot:TRINITY_DN16188_c0_g1_i1.p1 TRINITY_DN16188_c0_g1~~TRINITY_DN16188_c0_g1_i1.p1  ORF type:complete len:136 (-),score=22.70 TRINITY_DN16188_c0_g1_i1:397-804(-)